MIRPLGPFRVVNGHRPRRATGAREGFDNSFGEAAQSEPRHGSVQACCLPARFRCRGNRHELNTCIFALCLAIGTFADLPRFKLFATAVAFLCH